MLHKLDFVVAILVLSPPLHCLKCYTNFCLDGSEYCEQRCSRNESACVSSYHVNPRGSTVDLLFFQCSHAKTDACNVSLSLTHTHTCVHIHTHAHVLYMYMYNF